MRSLIMSDAQAWLSALTGAREALAIAVAVTVVALPLGYLLAVLINRATFWVCVLALGGCVVVLLQHGSGVTALPRAYPPDFAVTVALGLAMSRACAAAAMLLTAGLSRGPANLRLAARAAGARPFQAWRHAILRPLAWPLVASVAASFAIGLAAGPLRATLIPQFAIVRAWSIAPAVLLAVASLAALGALVRRRPA